MSPRDSAGQPYTSLITRVTIICATIAVIATLGIALQISQANSQRQLEQRFHARGQLAASFSSTWVTQLMDQELRVATNSLSGTPVSDASFAHAVDVFDFPAAVLLDSHGRALGVHPQAPQLIGSDLASRYPHLSRAVNGRPAISSAIISASRSVPVVAFAVPYETPRGRRVFSGAYELNRTPLGAFLDAVTPIADSRVYIVDAAGTVLASGQLGTDKERSDTMPASLAAARRTAPDGSYDDGGNRRHYFSSQRIAGTPWSLALTAPHETLFAPIRGRAHTLPWIVLGFVTLLAAAANWMLFRLLNARNKLRTLNTDLDTKARTDQLTGLPNRRHLEESLDAALSAGTRHSLPVSVLVMDLDHFKQVNDTFGHNTGDRVLEHVATLLQAAVRTEDVVGRWGGEEFLAVLPNTDAAGATRIAERIRQLVADTPHTHKAAHRPIAATLSIGCATTTAHGDTDQLIHFADQALYRAKTEGRNSVRSGLVPANIEAQSASTTHIAPVKG